MNKNRHYFTKSILRQFLTTVAVILVLLSSCPVKSGIKSLMNIPQNVEYSIVNKTSLTLHKTLEICSTTRTAVSPVQKISAAGTAILSAALFTAILFLFFGGFLTNETKHPRYNNIPIRGSLPIFLQHRKLII